MEASDLLDDGYFLVRELDIGIHQLRAHLAQHTWKEIAMKFLDDLVAAGQALKAERAGLVVERDGLKKQVADLQAQIAGDEQKAEAALSELSEEVEAEKSDDTAADAKPTDPIVEVDGASTSVTTPAGNITTVQHADGSSSTIDPTGATIETDQVAAAAAIQAAREAGVSVPVTQ